MTTVLACALTFIAGWLLNRLWERRGRVLRRGPWIEWRDRITAAAGHPDVVEEAWTGTPIPFADVAVYARQDDEEPIARLRADAHGMVQIPDTDSGVAWVEVPGSKVGVYRAYGSRP